MEQLRHVIFRASRITIVGWTGTERNLNDAVALRWWKRRNREYFGDLLEARERQDLNGPVDHPSLLLSHILRSYRAIQKAKPDE